MKKSTGKKFLRKLIKFITLPLTFLRKIILNLRKKIKLSITFKITSTYLGLYLLSLILVVVLTLMGYLGYKLFELNNTGDSYAPYIVEKTVHSKESLDQFIIDERIEGIILHDENFNLISQVGNKYDDYVINIFSKLEFIKDRKIYKYTNSYEFNGKLYYLTINFNIQKILSELAIIGIFISGAGLLGALILAAIGPIASKKIVRPIKDMTEVAKTITANNINTRLNVKASQYELKELAETFNKMMDRIEEDYIRQQHFVSDASHELRTPIAVMKGYADMLDRWGKKDQEVLEESIAAIKNETNNMQDLVEKLLFIARNDKNTLKLSKEEFVLKDLVKEVAKETKMIISNKNIECFCDDDSIIFADKNRIKQAIRIFVENAVKFTPDGGKIYIRCKKDGDFSVVEVEDTGIGIKKRNLKKIFDRFYKEELSREKEQGGHGLGLSIAKIIVLGHRGKIKVKSTYEKGSIFSIYLPYIKK
ncbi:MAG TPA: histidine kinase [Clostridiales bacterium]|jgi:signal transduction histidine kinase|nr:histidine kinase [Clostridiales bacterium]